MSSIPAPVTVIPFRLGYVPGVTLTKWVGVWKERHPQVPLELVLLTLPESLTALTDGKVHALIGRLPVPEGTPVHSISMYHEVSVVVIPKDHFVAAAEIVSLADLSDSILLQADDDALRWGSATEGAGSEGDEGTPSGDDEALALPVRPGESPRMTPETTEGAIPLVAAGIGVLVTPKSIARLYDRKDLTYREVSDAPTSEIGLIWPRNRAHPMCAELVGIIRGRSANSSRTNGDTLLEQDPKAARKAVKVAKAERAAARAAAARAALAKESAGKGGGKGGGSRSRKPTPAKRSTPRRNTKRG